MIKLIAGGSAVAGAGPAFAGDDCHIPDYLFLLAQKCVSLTKDAVKRRHGGSHYLKLLIFNTH